MISCGGRMIIGYKKARELLYLGDQIAPMSLPLSLVATGRCTGRAA